MKTFCIIPAYNEEKTIAKVISDVKPFVDEIIVVNDASQDKTSDLASKAGAIVINHLINRYQGAALETGNQYALKHGADMVVHFDADDQFVAKEIKNIIEPIKRNRADIVFGSRFLEIKSDLPRFKEKIIMPIARIVNRIFFNINTTDPQSGFRAMNRKALKKIKINQDGMAHCSEILHQAHEYDLTIKEVPITVIYHEFGQNFLSGIRVVKDIILAKLMR